MKKLWIVILYAVAISALLGCVEQNPNNLCWCKKIESLKLDPLTACTQSKAKQSTCSCCDSSCVDKPNSDLGDKVGNVLNKVTYFLIDPIKTQVQEVSIIVYDNIVTNTVYKNTVRIMLVLYITIYGIMFMYQLVPIKLADLMIRIMKIAIVLTLITTETSYKFFNDDLFKLFTEGSDYLLTIVTNPYCDNKSSINFFYFFNYVIDSLFSKNFWLTLLSLTLAFPVGWIALFILLTSVTKYLFAVIQGIIAYLLAFTAVALLISLAPIFLTLMLFDNTREVFDNWMKALVMFSLQPVILFAGIFFVTSFINEVFSEIFVDLTWKEVFPVYIDFGLGKFWLFSIYWYMPPFVDSFNDYLGFLTKLLILYLCVDLLGKLPSYVEGIAFKLVSGKGVGVIKHAKGIMGNTGQKMKGLIGMDKDSIARRRN